MNIFLLHESPDKAAKAHCDRHVPKLTLEAVQVANTGLHLAGASDHAFYKPTHKSHPWCEFASKSFDHFLFVVRRAQALGREFLRRYDDRHTSHQKIAQNWTHDDLRAIADELGRVSDADSLLSDVPLAMLDTYKCENLIEAYRQYYYNEKMTQDWFHFDKTKPPEWFVQGTPLERWN